jgi:hypothetical protein
MSDRRRAQTRRAQGRHVAHSPSILRYLLALEKYLPGQANETQTSAISGRFNEIVVGIELTERLKSAFQGSIYPDLCDSEIHRNAASAKIACTWAFGESVTLSAIFRLTQAN